MNAGQGEQACTQLTDAPFEFFADFLFMQASVDNIELGTKKHFTDATQTEVHKRTIDFVGDWKPGARVGFGYTFDFYDKWDLYGIWTYYNGHADASSSGGGETIAQYCNVGGRQELCSFLGTAWASARGKWHTHNNVFDLELGRVFAPTNHIHLRPFFGLRGFFFDLHVDNHYTGQFIDAESNIQIANTQFKGKSDCNGVGMRGGLNFNWMITQAFSFVTKMGVSLLWGHFDIQETFKGMDTTTGTMTPLTLRYKETKNTLRTNLDVAMGFQYDWLVNSCKNQVSLFIGYEMSKWFHFNELFSVVRVIDTASGSATATFLKTPLTGDVGFQGLDARLSVRF